MKITHTKKTFKEKFAGLYQRVGLKLGLLDESKHDSIVLMRFGKIEFKQWNGRHRTFDNVSNVRFTLYE